MIGRAPHPRPRLAATVALLALTLQTALPLIHNAQLATDVAVPPRCELVVSDGSVDSHSLDVDGTRVVPHDAEQCALCQAIHQGKRTVAAPGSTRPAHNQVRPADPVPSVVPAPGPTLCTTAPRGPPLQA